MISILRLLQALPFTDGYYNDIQELIVIKATELLDDYENIDAFEEDLELYAIQNSNAKSLNDLSTNDRLNIQWIVEVLRHNQERDI